MMRKEIVINLVWCSIFAFAAALHIIGINQPFLGNFAQHQTDYATVVQRWLATGMWDPLKPLMRFLALGENRIFLGDLPVNISVVTLICKATGWSIEFVGRGLSSLFFFFSLYPFYRLLSLITRDRSVLLWAITFYVFSPLTLIYSQTFLLEITALSLGLFGYYFFFRWSADRKIFSLVASAFFLSWMLGTRIYFAPIVLPLFLILVHRFRLHVFRVKEFYLFMFLTGLIPVLWQGYAAMGAITQGQESSLQDNLRVFIFADPMMKWNPNYFLPALQIILSRLLTPMGIVLAVLGLCFKNDDFKNIKRILLILIVSFIPLFVVAPRKFVEFDYYYLPLIPALAVLAALALQRMISGGLLSRRAQILIAILVAFFAARYSIAPILIIPDEDRYVLEAANEVRKVVPKEARIIAAHGGSTPFLFYTNRDGWGFAVEEKKLPEGYKKRHDSDRKDTAIKQLEHYRSQGAAYFALADKREQEQNPELFEYLNSQYPLVYESPHTLIYSLQKST